MGTTAFIARATADDTLEGIVLFYDGYPSHAGRILREHYSHEAQLQDLLNLGDLASIGETPASSERIHRGLPAKEYSRLPRDFDHTYVLDNGTWYINGIAAR